MEKSAENKQTNKDCVEEKKHNEKKHGKKQRGF